MPSTTGGRSTPSRRRSADPFSFRRLRAALAAEISPLRAWIPRDSPRFSRASIGSWTAWAGPFCPRCGAFSPVSIPDGSDGNRTCSDCPDDPAFLACRSLFPYRDEVREAIRRGKYGSLPLAVDAIADRLHRAIRADWTDLFPDRFHPVVVPVPILPRKFFRRGFNLPAVIGCRLARCAGWDFDPLPLRRIRERSPQARLPLSRRAANVRGSFAVPAGRRVPPEILLLDDVYTSGATAGECARVLKRGGAEHIVVLTVARTVP